MLWPLEKLQIFFGIFEVKFCTSVFLHWAVVCYISSNKVEVEVVHSLLILIQVLNFVLIIALLPSCDSVPLLWQLITISLAHSKK